jgi:hypothetical protein
MQALRPTDVCGTWTLVSFEIESLDKKVRAWGKDANGLLIYAETGHMSVSINKAIENDPSQTEAENLFDSILFYSGTYQIDGDLIRHQVTNASNPARIGKEMIRYPQLESDVLTLATPQESFGRAVLKWRRI